MVTPILRAGVTVALYWQHRLMLDVERMAGKKSPELLWYLVMLG
jgi:hypothetical protein